MTSDHHWQNILYAIVFILFPSLFYASLSISDPITPAVPSHSAELLAQIELKTNALSEVNTPESRSILEELKQAKTALVQEQNNEKAFDHWSRALELTTLYGIIPGLSQIFEWIQTAFEKTKDQNQDGSATLLEKDIQTYQNIALILKEMVQLSCIELKQAFLNHQDTREHRTSLGHIASIYVSLFQLMETLKLLSSTTPSSSQIAHHLLTQAKAKYYLGFNSLAAGLSNTNSPQNPFQHLINLQTVFSEAEAQLKEATLKLAQEERLVQTSSLHLMAQNLENFKPELQHETGNIKQELNETLQSLYAFRFENADEKLNQAIHQLRKQISDLPLDTAHAFHLIRNFLILSHIQKHSTEFSEDAAQSLASHFEMILHSQNADEYVKASTEFESLAVSLLGSPDPELLPTIAPDQTKIVILTFLNGLQAAVVELKAASQKRSFLEGFETQTNQNLEKALETLDRSLHELSIDVRQTTHSQFLQSVYRSRRLILNFVINTLDSIHSRSQSSLGFAKLLETQLIQIRKGPAYSFNSNLDISFRFLLKLERNELALRPWLSRRTLHSIASSAALIAILSGTLTGGTTTAAGLGAQSLLSTTLAVSTASLMTVSGLNLIDRYRFAGWGGLANLESAMDALSFLAFMPRPLTLVPPANPSTLQKAFYAGKTALARTQTAAGRLFWSSQILLSSYSLLSAETISKELARSGVHMSPSEIRTQAAFNLALGYLAFRVNGEYVRRGVENAKQVNPSLHGRDFLEAIKRELPNSDLFIKRPIKSLVNPWWSYKQSVDRIKNPRWYHHGLGITKGLFNAGILYIGANEIGIYGYSNPDFNFVNHIESEKPFPTLNDGESAVTMIGLQPADLLYFGAKSDHFDRMELDRYGSRFQKYDYDSATNLIEELQNHRLKYGPIRYLKIVAHGLPGRLGTGSGNFFDSRFLQDNKEKLKKITRNIFAPDARIVFVSCLVGANMDERVESLRFGFHEVKDGETFVNEFADIFLVNGGRLDTSTRILLGFDLLMGSAFSESETKLQTLDTKIRHQSPLQLDSEIATYDPKKTLHRLLPYAHVFQEDTPQIPSSPPPLLEFNAHDSLDLYSEKLGRTLRYIYRLWTDYGTKLEGGFNQSRYRSIEVPAHD